jgi:hypothetical protein
MARDKKVDGTVGKHGRERSPAPARFDYNSAAELFLARTKSTARRPRYKRFDTAAEGVRFVVEDLPAAVRPGPYLLVNEARVAWKRSGTCTIASFIRCRVASRNADRLSASGLLGRLIRKLAGEPPEVVEDGSDQLLPTGILGLDAGREQIEQIARLLGGVLPVLGRGCQQLRFQRVLPGSQGIPLRAHLGVKPPQPRFLLRCHSTAFVQINSLFAHRQSPWRRA